MLSKLKALPKFMRIICIATAVFFGLLGLGLTLKSAAAGGSLVLGLLYFLLILLAAEAMTVGAYYLLVHASSKAICQKVSALYEQQGQCIELAKCIEESFSFGDAQTQLRRVFFYLMAEDYENAEKFMHPLPDKVATQRERAMLNTCRMWLYVMTARMERCERVFLDTFEEQNHAYQMFPDMQMQYHPESDDALLYFLLASAMCVRLQDGAGLADYRGQFDFQLSKRCQADQKIYPDIYRLFLHYAKGELDAAHALEQSLRAAVETGTPLIPYSRQGDMKRLTEQARLFAKYVQVIAPAQPAQPAAQKTAAGILSDL